MPGVFDPYDLPPALAGQPSIVMRYDSSSGVFTPLPSVRWTEITYRKGPYPPRATFRYAFGEPAGFSSTLFEALLPIVKKTTTDDTVMLDDRIVVATIDLDGKLAFMFDGFMQIPEGQISGQNYNLSFQCQGVAIRCWDWPLVGSYRRDMHKLSDPKNGTFTDLPARVNPEGKANATDDPNDDNAWDYALTTDRARPFPTFVENPYWNSTTDKSVTLPKTRKWSIGMVARYLLAVGNGLETYVNNPDFGLIDDILSVYEADGTTKEIDCKDLVLSGKPWPEALNEAIRNHGFTFTFRLGTKDKKPYNYLTFERERDGRNRPLKSLYLQEAGAAVNPAKSNAKAFSLAVDASQVVNEYRVQYKSDEYEVGIVLAPGFSIDKTNDPLNAKTFLSSNPDPTADRDKYRLFVADECGEGQWQLNESLFVKGNVFHQFDQLWGANWVVRHRPGYGPCFTLDPKGHRYKPQLFALTNWNQVAGGKTAQPPTLFDPKNVSGSNTPYVVPIKGSWELLQDRLGVRLTMTDPTEWNIGTVDPSNPAYDAVNGGKINLIDLMTNYDKSHPEKFIYLLLTCVIAGDRQTQTATANKRSSSPTKYAVARHVDGGDRYKRWAIHRSSAYQQNNTDLFGSEVDDARARFYSRDDSDVAQQYAEALRESTESPSFAGSVTIGRITNTYFVGDRIEKLEPRMSLQTNVPSKSTGNSTGSTSGTGSTPPRYPQIVQLTWRNEPEQSTTLQLDDRRSESDPIEV